MKILDSNSDRQRKQGMWHTDASLILISQQPLARRTNQTREIHNNLKASDCHPNVSITILPYHVVFHPFTDTNEPMAPAATKISLSVTGDGGSHQGSSVFQLQQWNGDQILQLHGWKLLLQGLLHSITQANTIPLDGLMDWFTLCPVSLYSLGFVLLLGHHGDPCPCIVEAWSEPSSFCSLTYHIFRVLKLLRRVSP